MTLAECKDLKKYPSGQSLCSLAPSSVPPHPPTSSHAVLSISGKKEINIWRKQCSSFQERSKKITPATFLFKESQCYSMVPQSIRVFRQNALIADDCKL